MTLTSLRQFCRAAIFAVLIGGPISASAVVVNFGMGADDYASLTINGTLVCVYDNMEAAGGCNGSFDMTPGVWYDIVIEYQNRLGSDGMALSWDQPGTANAGGYGFGGAFPNLVPKASLRTQSTSGAYVSGLRGDYKASCATQTSVIGEGPINAINDIYNNQPVGSWNGCGYFDSFFERLSGQIQIPAGASLLYSATFEGFAAGTALAADPSGGSVDRPRSIDTNLTATVENGSTVPSGTPTLNSTRFARLKESCGEAPDLGFDRGIALGTADSPNAIAHIGLDMLFETSDAYHVYFRNGAGSGIPGPASQSIADITITGSTIRFASLNTNTTSQVAIGVPVRLDTYFDLGRKRWYADLNGTRVVNGAPFINSPLGLAVIGFGFTGFCDQAGQGGLDGAMQFDNFRFEQVSAVPLVASPPLSVGTVASDLGRPFGVAIYNGAAYVPDPSTHRVWKVDVATGAKSVVAGTGDQGFNGDGIDALQAQLDNPSGVAVDASGLYIADTGNHIVRRIANPGVTGAVMTTVAGIPTAFAVGESTPAECATTPTASQCTLAMSLRLFGPRALALDSAGGLYIIDRMNQQIKKLYTSGPLKDMIFVVAGIAGYPGGNNGPANGPLVCAPDITCSPGARLNSPVGLGVDANGTVYVATEGSNNIRVVSSGVEGPPTVTTLAAGPLVRPTGVAVDGNGNVYIANYGNHVIVQPACDTSCTNFTIAGTPGVRGSDAAHLNSPIAIAVDGTTLYIADMLNGRLSRVNISSGIDLH